MESTGTYGDPLRDQMALIEVPVFRVSTKHTHDAAELFDGVPSSSSPPTIAPPRSASVVTWHDPRSLRIACHGAPTASSSCR